MYCGDETGAFVGDIGYATSRFGYGGEDCPKHVVPSWTLPGGSTPPASSSTLRCPARLKAGPEESGGVGSRDAVPIFDWSRSGSVDPDDYLAADAAVRDWAACEAAWHGAFRTLRVRDGRKHTTGGSGGGAEEEEEGQRCVHPVLAVDSGHYARCFRGRDGPDDPLSGADAGGGGGRTGGPGGGAAAVNNNRHEGLRLRERAALVEMLFEKFDAPAVFVAPAPMLAAFAHGRQTGLVVDVGAAGTRVTPVVDGLVLGSAQRRTGRGGEWLGAVQGKALVDRCGLDEVVPRYAVGAGDAGGGGGGGEKRRRRTVSYPFGGVKDTTFHRLAVSDLMYEMRTGSHVTLSTWRSDESVPFVGYDGERKRKRDGEDGGEGVDGGDDGNAATADVADEEGADGAAERVYYELPDGTRVDLGKSRAGKDLCRLPELFYTDEIPFVDMPQDSSSSSASKSFVAESTLSNLPIHRLAHSSLTAVGDGDARKELCGNILLTGASSLYPNMETRFSYEMSNVAPTAYKCKVVASRNTVERRYASWIGGSILTSLGSFQQLWLSRAEYEEYGVALGTNRFP